MDVRVTPPQQAIGLRLDGLIAFASGFLQALRIEDADMTTTVAQEAGLLQRVCDNRHAGSPHAHHLRDEFLGQLQIIAALPRSADSDRLLGWWLISLKDNPLSFIQQTGADHVCRHLRSAAEDRAF
jgi:hypothetical protein